MGTGGFEGDVDKNLSRNREFGVVMSSNPRQALEQLCEERGENFASLSRLIGRKDAYIQQYLRKGTPRQV